MKRAQILFTFLILLNAFSCNSQKKVVDKDDKVKLIEKKINTYTNNNNLHGAILIASEGIIELEAAFGENSYGLKNQIETPFDIASIGKILTGIAIAQLEASGKLRYSDKLSSYITNYTEKPITIHHLLTHTSGIPDIFNFDFIQKTIQINSIEIDDYFNHFKDNPYSIEFFKNQPLDFEPGSKFSYSNSGYLLLGLIIEKVTGLKFSTYVDKNILAPLEMNNTKLVSSYGGGPSTLRDMLKLYKGLTNDSLIKGKQFKFISSGKTKMGKKKYYAYGFEDDLRFSSRIISHKGGNAESKAQFIMFPDTKYFVIIYANNNIQGYKQFNKLRDYTRKVLSQYDSK